MAVFIISLIIGHKYFSNCSSSSGVREVLNVLKSQSDTKIHLDINSPDADVTLRKIEDNSPENNITRIDMSLGGRSYAP